MALNQRRVKILHLIREDGHAKVQDLSKIFNVTDVTSASRPKPMHYGKRPNAITQS